MTFLLDPLTIDNLIRNMWGPSNENFPGWKVCFGGFFWVGKQTKQKKSAQNESVFLILGELTL